MKEVATAKFSFEELRTKGFVYVDKTDLLARLASDDDAAYFISCPRRFGQIPAQWKISCEADAKRHFLLFAEMLGAKPRPEVVTARGSADAIIETPKAVYVFEFKYNRSAAAAIRQIRDKGYADAYRAGTRPVMLVGINFSSRTRNVQEPKIENFRVTLTRHVRISDKKALSTKSPKRRKTK